MKSAGAVPNPSKSANFLGAKITKSQFIPLAEWRHLLPNTVHFPRRAEGELGEEGVPQLQPGDAGGIRTFPGDVVVMAQSIPFEAMNMMKSWKRNHGVDM